MTSVTVILEIDPARVDEFLSIMTANAAASRQEPGCTRFEISRLFDSQNVFALSEAYRDRDAMEYHFTTPHYAKWKAASESGIALKRTAVRGDVIDH